MRSGTTFFLAVAVMAATITISAQAQSTSCATLVANISFQFNVGSKTLPAGQYTVSCMNSYSDQRVLRLLSEDGRHNVLIQMGGTTGKSEGSARLVFRRYEDMYFFAKVWMPASGIGLESRKSRSERAIARRFAGSSPRVESVALLAR